MTDHPELSDEGRAIMGLIAIKQKAQHLFLQEVLTWLAVDVPQAKLAVLIEHLHSLQESDKFHQLAAAAGMSVEIPLGELRKLIELTEKASRNAAVIRATISSGS